MGRVAHLAGVRSHMIPGKDYGTYGKGQDSYYYHPGDVQRAAVAISEGRVDVPSIWRTDTPDGRRAEYWSRFRLRLTITIFLVWLGGGLGLMAWYLVPLAYEVLFVRK
ncbi:hypothetical protein ACIRYZ_18195 [Kitasatospora sp. NPDC101155]|uniref:hypothetical protein n=1 Tax=Kitasatospora sp. NPDC101155 TaxID=3364097 RepID=UPI0038287166